MKNHIFLFIYTILLAQRPSVRTPLFLILFANPFEKRKSVRSSLKPLLLFQKTEKSLWVWRQTLESSRRRQNRCFGQMNKFTSRPVGTVAVLVEFSTRSCFVLRRKIVLVSLIKFAMGKVALIKQMITFSWKGQCRSWSQYLHVYLDG